MQQPKEDIMELIIEYKLNDTKELVFRCIYFDFDKDTGAKYVSDLIDYSVAHTNHADLALHNIDWEDLTEIRVIASTHNNAVLDTITVKDTYEAAYELSLLLAVCICDYKNVCDDDGSINTDGQGKPCLQEFIATRHVADGTLNPYRRAAHKPTETFPCNPIEADIGKPCVHGSHYGKCPSSQCHVWTEAEIEADCPTVGSNIYVPGR